jgi:hypothetical protein
VPSACEDCDDRMTLTRGLLLNKSQHRLPFISKNDLMSAMTRGREGLRYDAERARVLARALFARARERE